jgi:maltose/moltooligosaccharide transporter
MERTVRSKPTLSFWQIFNMCFGFMGIQFAFALQNSNMSRIFQTLGAKIEEIPILWIAGPLTGLFVQPIIGYLSDHTWGALGRRRPYFVAGAVLATIALIWMPNSAALWTAAMLLWVLDASINVSMEPFRALVGDQLGPKQRPSGYAMQSFFIGVGAVVASALPYVLEKFGVPNVAADGQIPDTVRYSFYAGAAALILAMAWTVISTKEYSPEQLEEFERAERFDVTVPKPDAISKSSRALWAMASLVAGAGLIFLVMHYKLEQQLYVLAGLMIGFGLAYLIANAVAGDSLPVMPTVMHRLAWVQFFSWFALFAMWIYTTAAVTQWHYNTVDTASSAYNEGGNWVGLLFAAYNGFAAIAAIFIPMLSKRIGLRATHLVNLWLGAAALASFYFIKDPRWLMVSMVGIGFAWASILSIPYVLLADHLPAKQMGVYMGIFNFFIVIPQLVAATILGVILKHFFGNQPIFAMMIGAVSFTIAGLLSLSVPGRSDQA